jgi:hemolysin activation/secretion protein
MNGQFSHQSLYPTKQMYLGGVYSVRVISRVILVDYGVNGTLELYNSNTGLNHILPKK